MLPGGRYQLATEWDLFANTFTQIDSESFSSSVIGICEMSLWTSNMTPPPWIFLSFYRRDRASLNYSISILLVWRKMLTSFMYRLIWVGSSEFGSYHLCESEGSGDPAQSRQNLSCWLKQAMSQEELSDRKPDPWPLWMTGHEQLKFFMTRNARRHKYAWRGSYSCASVNNNKKCAIGRSENERKSVLWGKMFIFVVAYMNMINDVGNLT